MLNLSESVLQDMIETESSFVGALTSPITTDTLEITFTEVSGRRKRQADTRTIEIAVTPGKYLIEIPRDKLIGLRGEYEILVSLEESNKSIMRCTTML